MTSRTTTRRAVGRWLPDRLFSSGKFESSWLLSQNNQELLWTSCTIRIKDHSLASRFQHHKKSSPFFGIMSCQQNDV
jgi:hypothetical protein